MSEQALTQEQRQQVKACIDLFFFGNGTVHDNIARVAFAAYRAGASGVQAQLEQAQMACAEAYQAVGSMLVDLGKFGTEQADKLLDNLDQYKLVHDDVLPWPSFRDGVQAQPVAWDASQIKQPGWHHVEGAFIEGAREARANPDADEFLFRRAADGYTKRVFEEIDPESEKRLRTGDFAAPAPAALQARIAELETEITHITTQPPTGNAPCARLCEHMAFLIGAKQDAAKIAELERFLSVFEDQITHHKNSIELQVAACNLQAERIAELEAQLPQWRPIEEAPKDGRTLLLGLFNSHGNWRTMRGQWFSKEEIAESWEEPDDPLEGWYETAVEPDPPNCWFIEPTHYIPLPPAPKEAV